MSFGPEANTQALRDRVEGRARTGIVTLRDFDQGVIETLGATVTDENYFLAVAGIAPPPGVVGVPVTFAFPDDAYEKYRMPAVVIRRDDLSPATQRWHPGAMQYRAPGEGANPVVASTGASGFDRMEESQQAVPYDILYTISIMARHRGATGQRHQSNLILNHVLRVYQPYCLVRVKDSLGDFRTYEAFNEGVGMLDEAPGVTERSVGFAITLRVEAELDLNDPAVSKTVTAFPSTNLTQR